MGLLHPARPCEASSYQIISSCPSVVLNSDTISFLSISKNYEYSLFEFPLPPWLHLPRAWIGRYPYDSRMIGMGRRSVPVHMEDMGPRHGTMVHMGQDRETESIWGKTGNQGPTGARQGTFMHCYLPCSSSKPEMRAKGI